jgi:hypothetical protein
MLAFSCILAWETAAPILMENTLGLTPEQFGWITALVALFYFFGAYINSRIVKKHKSAVIIPWGAFGLLIGTLAMVIPALFHYTDIYVITLPMLVVMFALGFIVPNSFSGAMQPFANISGITVAVLGSIQVSGSFVTSSLIAFFPDRNQLPLAGFLLAFGILTIILTRILKRKTLNTLQNC